MNNERPHNQLRFISEVVLLFGKVFLRDVGIFYIGIGIDLTEIN